MYEIFLLRIRNFIKSETKLSFEEIEKTLLWEYICSCFVEHKDSIEAIMKCWYIIDEIFFRDYLSGPYATIKISEVDKFDESMNSPSDLMVHVIFSLPNKIWDEKLSETRYLKIGFSKAGMSWMF